MKKVTAMLLLLALFMSLALPASATGVEPCAGCTAHTWQNTSTLVRGSGIYYDATRCKSYWRETRTCTNCGAAEFVGYYYLTYSTHKSHSTLVSAECNGTTQTHYYYCYSCGNTLPLVVNFPCPDGPHSGSCDSLPV